MLRILFDLTLTYYLLYKLAFFSDSKFLKHVAAPLGGVLYLQHSKSEGTGDILWAHTTHTMCVGYMGTSFDKPKVSLSTLPLHVAPGEGVMVEGACFATTNDDSFCS